MDAPQTPPHRTRPVRQPILLGLFAGVGVAVGYLLAGVPGVELMSLVACVAGVALGPARGALAGGLAAAVYSLGSPYGMAAPPLLVAQVLGMALPGVLGGLAATPLVRRTGRGNSTLLAGGLGLAAAFGFDLLTNLGIIVGYALDWRVVLPGAAGMAAVHMAVNGAIFASVLPAAARRVAVLARGSLRGGSATVALVLILLLAPGGARAQDPVSVPADSVAVVAPVSDAAVAAPTDSMVAARPPLPAGAPTGPAALGWKRGLWTPFALNALNWLDWWSPRVVVAEAGTGAPAYVLGEASTSLVPLTTVDGVPWGTGHALADDPWLTPQQGLRWEPDAPFADGLGGTGGRLALAADDPDPARAVSTYHGVKGRHESYMRGIDVLTADAPWRVAFAFEEVIDKEAWNYTDQPDEIFRPDDTFYPGNSKVRQSRTRLQRVLDPDNRLTLEFSTGRKTRSDVPSWHADQQEIWDTGVAATMDGTSRGMRWRAIAHWRDRDVQWGNYDAGRESLVNPRKVETGREGLILELGPRTADDAAPAGLTALRLAYHQWAVDDRSDTVRTRPADLGPTSGRGRQVRLEAGSGRRFGGQVATAAVYGNWDERVDIAPGWAAAIGQDSDRPHWCLELGGDGRAPRSDELLTPWERYIDGRELTILPNYDLGREHTLRAGVSLRARLLGTEVAVEAAARRLTDGITWVPLEGQDRQGRWQNGLEMDSAILTGRLERQGRLLGWARVLVEGTWQTIDEKTGQAAFLPPTHSGRLALFWENHYFGEDGILQLGLQGRWRGSMNDPWDVTRTYMLPASTVLDLLVGFRLVGANLSMAFKNLTGERTQMSAGTWSAGQETDLRLMWSFRH